MTPIRLADIVPRIRRVLQKAAPDDLQRDFDDVVDAVVCVDDVHDTNATRFEIIDETGRILVINDPNLRVQISLQDNGTTLKVFLEK